MAEQKTGLGRKAGPLPLWAWGLILGIGGYFLYTRYMRANSTSPTSTSPTASVLDPNAVDPNTGLTFGQEEASALNAAATQAAAPSSGGLDTSTTGTGTTSGNLTGATSELGDLATFLGSFGTIAQDLGYTNPNINPPMSQPTQAAAASAPVTPPQTPAAAPTAHMEPATIDTHPGGQFYNWYKSVYGYAPPAQVSPNAARYVAWTKGLPKAQAKGIQFGSVYTGKFP